MTTHLVSVITCTQPSSTTPTTSRYFPPCTCTRRFWSLRDRPSSATCPSSSFSASWVSCCDSPGSAGTRATQHQGTRSISLLPTSPRQQHPAAPPRNKETFWAASPVPGTTREAQIATGTACRNAKKPLQFFFPKHPSLLFGLAGSQVRAGSPCGHQPAPKHNGRTWESLPSLFPSLQTRRLGRRKEFRHHVGSYILRMKQPPLFLARW